MYLFDALQNALIGVVCCMVSRRGQRVRVCSLMFRRQRRNGDEPESLILAQSERWRHA
jgi:hypothetical protein